MPEVMLGISTKRRVGISVQGTHSVKEQTSNNIIKADNINSSYHFIASMCLAYTRYFIGFCLILLLAYKISIVPMLNEKNETKRINMWLLICIARVKAQDLF